MTAPNPAIASTILISLINLLVLEVFSKRRSATSTGAWLLPILLPPVFSADPLVDRQTLRRLEPRAKTNLPSGRRDPAQPVPTCSAANNSPRRRRPLQQDHIRFIQP